MGSYIRSFSQEQKGTVEITVHFVLIQSDTLGTALSKGPTNMVLYESSVKPELVGSQIRFTFSNIEPNEDDNLAIEFGKMTKKQAASYFTRVIQSYLHNSLRILPEADVILLKRCIQNNKTKMNLEIQHDHERSVMK